MLGLKLIPVSKSSFVSVALLQKLFCVKNMYIWRLFLQQIKQYSVYYTCKQNCSMECISMYDILNTYCMICYGEIFNNWVSTKGKGDNLVISYTGVTGSYHVSSLLFGWELHNETESINPSMHENTCVHNQHCVYLCPGAKACHHHPQCWLSMYGMELV